MSIRNTLCIAVVCGLVIACTTPKPFYNRKEKDWAEKKMPDDPVRNTVYLLGGLPDDDSSETILKMLRESMGPADTNHLIAFLDDPETSGDYSSDWMEFLRNDKGKLLFIPGEQEKGKKSFGKEEKKEFEKKLDRKEIFLPEDGCPGPEEIQLTEDLLLVALNTASWLEGKEEKSASCKNRTEKEWTEELKDILDNNQRKNILVVGHHPIMSIGNNAGFFSLRQHLFPLTDLHRSLYLPLPVAGSLYPWLRAGIGTRHDFGYPRYKRLRGNMQRAFGDYGNVVYASGQEHNFQYFKYNKQDYIISNSSGDITWTGRKSKAGFTYSAKGFTKVTYYRNGEVWLEFFAAGKASPVVYRKRLKDNVYGSPKDTSQISSSSEIAGTTMLIAADSNLEAGKFKQFFLGKHYRKAWTTPVQVPVLDLRNEQGGLEIIKKGGGFQTKSLRLKNKKGEEYTLRSVVKYPERLLGPILMNTIAADVVRDQASSIHPYGPMAVDDLSEAGGILHTHPKIVYIPKDTLLREYRKDFANTVALFEQRADGKMQASENFGYANESISSDKMFEELKEDNGNRIDETTLLKSRLFDMWINDWDRHDGQWRWGVIECGDTNETECKRLRAKDRYYVPIPKDRDQAFSSFDGVLPWLAGRKWVARKFQDFTEDIRDVPGLNWNARHFDHALLTGLSREEWKKAAAELQQDLTDAKIEKAIRQFPDTIYRIDGPHIIRILKARRENLVSFATRYYDFLAAEVDVFGSDKKEFFEVERRNADSTSVKIFAIEEDTQMRLLYDRVFLTDETKEVRLYGLGGDDIFVVRGEAEKGITVRLIGGEGEDNMTDSSEVNGWRRKTKVYDVKNKNELHAGPETANRFSKDKEVNAYNYRGIEYNLVAPAAFFGFNQDDGLFLGGGVAVKHHSFRKKPYAYFQKIVANVSLKSTAVNVRYTGDFTGVFGKWGIGADFSAIAPKGTTNFYGLGNETKELHEEDGFYRYRFDNIIGWLSLNRLIGEHHFVSVGPVYEYIKVEDTPGKYLSSEGQFYLGGYSPRHHAGGKLEYRFQHTNDSVLTFRGIKWISSVAHTSDLQHPGWQSTNLESQLCVYVPVGNKSTVAVRGGGSHRLGKFEFYQANILGGFNKWQDPGNLRGYLRGRYSGRTAAYINADWRIKILGFRTYFFPSHFGILAFYDTGRVWADHEKSSIWHSSYGGGIWIDPFKLTVLNLSYAISKEDSQVSVGIGFLF